MTGLLIYVFDETLNAYHEPLHIILCSVKSFNLMEWDYDSNIFCAIWTITKSKSIRGDIVDNKYITIKHVLDGLNI